MGGLPFSLLPFLLVIPHSPRMSKQSATKFKAGDRVKCIQGAVPGIHGGPEEGKYYTVTAVFRGYLSLKEVTHGTWLAYRFVKARKPSRSTKVDSGCNSAVLLSSLPPLPKTWRELHPPRPDQPAEQFFVRLNKLIAEFHPNVSAAEILGNMDIAGSLLRAKMLGGFESLKK